MTPEQIKAIRERCEKATSGPWQGAKDEGVYTESGEQVFATGCGCCTSGVLSVPDADFIAHARSDVPALLAEVDRLRGVLRRCRAFIAAIRDSNTEDGRSGVGNDILTAIDRALSGDDAQGGR